MICSFHSLGRPKSVFPSLLGHVPIAGMWQSRSVDGTGRMTGKTGSQACIQLITQAMQFDDHYRYLLACTGCPPPRRFRLRRVFADRRLWPTFPIDRRAR